MFVKTLKSLVVRGVSVLSDGKAVSVRLGFGDLTTPQNPEIPISMRHGGCAGDHAARAPTVVVAHIHHQEVWISLELLLQLGRAHGRNCCHCLARHLAKGSRHQLPHAWNDANCALPWM